MAMVLTLALPIFAIDRTCWQSVFTSKKPLTNKAAKMFGECDFLATVCRPTMLSFLGLATSQFRLKTV
jgi:hypothetical protein